MNMGALKYMKHLGLLGLFYASPNQNLKGQGFCERFPSRWLYGNKIDSKKHTLKSHMNTHLNRNIINAKAGEGMATESLGG